MAAYRPLQRDLPLIRKDGSIKFRDVLGLARRRRATRRRQQDAGSALNRLDAVRADLTPIRERITHDRSFWSVDNTPDIEMERITVTRDGRSWFEFVPVKQGDANSKTGAA